MTNDYFKLMLVTQRQTDDLSAYLDFVEQCLLGGVSSVQLREKNAPMTSTFRFAVQLKGLCERYRVPLLINDHLELAIDLNADGVHLGQSDTDCEEARRRFGEAKIIGLSLEDERQIDAANASSVNYVAASAVFATRNKTNVQKLWGLSGISLLANLSQHPVVAIGGITALNVEEVIQAGANGVALIGALHNSKEPRVLAQRLREKIDQQVLS